MSEPCDVIRVVVAYVTFKKSSYNLSIIHIIIIFLTASSAATHVCVGKYE